MAARKARQQRRRAMVCDAPGGFDCGNTHARRPTLRAPPIHRSDPMQYRRLGASGLQLSALSFGAWMTFGRQVGRGQARELVAAAWDHGINFFDNAEVYANGEAERVMGDVIADLRLDRKSVV